MTALIELKQKLKNIYAKNELYLQPILKFTVAMVFFIWINENLGYMIQLTNIFVVLILALVCSILPSGVTAFIGFVMIVGHAYALSLEAGAFALVLILFLSILFLRFSGGQNLSLVCTPLAFGFDIPVLLPIGSGLLGNAFTVFPAVSGVIVYYFTRQLRVLSGSLSNPDVDALAKVKMLADGMVQNWAMWLTVLAFAITILMVNLIRTRSFNYAWKVAIICGGICYVLVMLVGGMFLEVTIALFPLLIQTVLSVVIGLVIEFFFFGGDYSRVERLEYEDDEYFYYVKAVPKTTVAVSERSIKKITEPREEKSGESKSKERSKDRSDSKRAQETEPAKEAEVTEVPDNGAVPVSPDHDVDHVDFEKKLEESLKDL